MSKISSDECFVIDMEWYGVDRQGNIAVFCSAGEGYLPEFVCEDKERADELIEYFNLIKEVPPTSMLQRHKWGWGLACFSGSISSQ